MYAIECGDTELDEVDPNHPRTLQAWKDAYDDEQSARFYAEIDRRAEEHQHEVVPSETTSKVTLDAVETMAASIYPSLEEK